MLFFRRAGPLLHVACRRTIAVPPHVRQTREERAFSARARRSDWPNRPGAPPPETEPLARNRSNKPARLDSPPRACHSRVRPVREVDEGARGCLVYCTLESACENKARRRNSPVFLLTHAEVNVDHRQGNILMQDMHPVNNKMHQYDREVDESTYTVSLIYLED